MKKALLALGLVVGMAGMSQAVLPTAEVITVADTAIGFTASIYQQNAVNMVTCSAETAQMRFRVDGTDPSSTVGHLLEVGQWICIGNCTGLAGSPAFQQIASFKAIRTGGSSGTLFCTYE